ncbi:MAG: hypothetical protein ABIT10_04780 [Alteraurantiacibacter sp.]
MNKRTWAILAALNLAAIWPISASAQIAGQEASPGAARLGECVLGSTTGNDRVLVGRWIGAALASAPQLEGLVTVDTQQKDVVDRELAQLFVRLFTQDCAATARPLIMAGDSTSIQMAFSMLGEAAMRELMTNPAAMTALTGYAQYIPPNAFDSLRSSAEK